MDKLESYLVTSLPSWFPFQVETTKPPPLEAMFQALKISTEAFLEQEISLVEVSIPMGFDAQTAYVDSILDRIELRRMNCVPARVVLAATPGNGIGDDGKYRMM